jgi:hypothetical protein
MVKIKRGQKNEVNTPGNGTGLLCDIKITKTPRHNPINTGNGDKKRDKQAVCSTLKYQIKIY